MQVHEMSFCDAVCAVGPNSGYPLRGLLNQKVALRYVAVAVKQGPGHDAAQI